jgi:uncharacterized protein (TIGR02117 family)
MAWHRLLIRIALALALLVSLPAIAILAGSTIPANRAAVQPAQGVQIYVYSNGVHTGIVVPAVNALHDWRPRIRADDLPDPRRAGDWFIIGWGERDFYLNTPTWSDVDPMVVLRAAVGSDRTLLHVDHLKRTWRGPDLRPLTLTQAQYRALVTSIERDFAPGAAIRGYGDGDVFYPSHGRYSARRTCNEWTGSKLRAIGIRIGLWTPSAWSVMRWF